MLCLAHLYGLTPQTPDIGFDWDSQAGRPFSYFCYGAACCEVELDVLTGDSSLLRADLVMDVGASLNPAIDIGQVEGNVNLLSHTIERAYFRCGTC